MDLNDFGTQCPASNARQNEDGIPYAPREVYSPSEMVNRPIQWKVVQAGIYEVCGTTARQLPPGAYGCTLNQYGEVQLVARDLQVDDLIDFADSLPSKILREIESFWDLGDKFQRGSTPTRFGTKNDYLRMVAVLHANGIDVIQDMVWNHLDGAGSENGGAGGQSGEQPVPVQAPKQPLVETEEALPCRQSALRSCVKQSRGCQGAADRFDNAPASCPQPDCP